MHKREDHHNSPEQIRGYVLDSLALADELELTPEDRAALLPELVKLHSSKQIFYTDAAAPPAFDLARLSGRR